MTNSTSLEDNPLALVGVITSAAYLFLCIMSGCLIGYLRLVKVEMVVNDNGTVKTRTLWQKLTSSNKHVVADIFTYRKRETYCNRYWPGEPCDYKKGKGLFYPAVLLFILRLILFILAWSLFGCSLLYECPPNFTVSQLEQANPRNAALLANMVMTIIGAVIDVTAIVSVWCCMGCFSCESCACRCCVRPKTPRVKPAVKPQEPEP